jgi:tetratricopeptide (TPR) repeat protein
MTRLLTALLTLTALSSFAEETPPTTEAPGIKPKLSVMPFAALTGDVPTRAGAKAVGMLTTEFKSADSFALVDAKKDKATGGAEELLEKARADVTEAKELRGKKKFRLAEEALQRSLTAYKSAANALTDVSEVVDAYALLAAVQYNTGRDDDGAKGDDDGALNDFDAAVKADPKNVHGLQLRGSAYSEKGEKDKALGDFKDAIALDPNNAATYLYRAHLYLVEADPESALADLEEVMRRAPDFPGAANDYAWTLATNPKDSVRNGRKAIEFAKKACHETDYKHAPTVDTLAAAHAESGDWDGALKWQQEALTLAEKTHPDDVKGMKERLALFKEKKAFREVPVREKKHKP